MCLVLWQGTVEEPAAGPKMTTSESRTAGCSAGEAEGSAEAWPTRREGGSRVLEPPACLASNPDRRTDQLTACLTG